MACATALAISSPAAEERKTVTTLFCDLVGFTAMTEATDPEDIDRLLREYFGRATRVVEEHGGVVEKFIGDAVVGVFGVPVVHEDDPARAVRAGLILLRTLAGLTRPDGKPLQARVGVNTGLAVVRLDVAPGSGEGFLTGDAVNTAARLQGAAPPMGVVVGELTHRLTAYDFAYSDLQPMALKGKAGHVKAWLATAPLTTSSTRRTAAGGTPMVGRAHELEACAEAVTMLGGGAGGLLLITGEAGIGKTRLVEELRVKAIGRGCAWLEGHTLSFGRSISYLPFLEIVQQDAGITADDGEVERAAKLTARVTALFGDGAPEVLPYLATLLGVPVSDDLAERVKYLDGEAMGHQLYRASRLYFASLARERPLVVALEDLHWLDASSAALLEHLLPLVHEFPVLFCCISRPDVDSPLARIAELARSEYREKGRQVALQTLTTTESTVLIQELTGLAELPAALRDAILSKAQGNPFFVEEIVRSLIEFGGLERDEVDGFYRVTPKADAISIPDSLLGVIVARVDRLDEDLKQVLRLASVIGRSFFYRLLAAIDDAERDLDRSLAGLEQRELVLERARDPELEYMFKHALVQEATYKSILLKRRKELHRRVAAAIETLFPEQAGESSSLLAYHYSKAEEWEKAQEYLFKAADQAGSIAADAEALAHYQDAIDAYTRAFGDTWDPLERAGLERKMGEALFRRGEQELATEYFCRALAILGRPLPTSSARLRRAIAVQLVRQLWHRLFPWLQPRTRKPEAVRAAEERCRVYETLVWANMMSDLNVWLLGLLWILNEGESFGLDWAASQGSSGMAMLAHVAPSRWLFRLYIRRARALAEREHLDHEMAQADLITGMFTYWTQGDLAQTSQVLHRAARTYQRLGETRHWATALGLVTYVPAERGEWSEGLATSREMAAAGTDTGDVLTEVWGQAWEAELLYMAGDIGAGEEGMRRTVDAMLRMMDFRIGGKVAGRLAACLLAQGRLEEAQELLEMHRGIQRKLHITGGNATAVIVGLAAAALLQVARSEGDARSTGLKKAKRACRAALKQTRVDKTSLVPAWRLRGQYEWLRGRTGRARTCWSRSLREADRLGCRYQGAITMLEIGRRLGDRGHLERAEAEFAAMGARFWLAQTQDLLAALPD
jgi:class 3 adenylate cyclase/tetratricopeptide (TPR) repeat protein